MANNIVQIYIKQIRKCKKLPQKEINRLLTTKNRTTKTENKVTKSFLPLVIHLATAYHRVWSKFDIMDLIQEGNIGLMRGIKNYNSKYKIKTTTYVYYHIKATIYRYIQTNTSILKITKSPAHERIFDNLSRKKRDFDMQEIKFNTKNVAEDLNVEEEDLINVKQALEPMDNIDNYENSIVDSQLNPLEQIIEDERQQQIKEQFDKFKKTLTQKQLYVFNNRIIADIPKTLEEIAKITVTTKQNIKDMEQRILKRAREFFDKNKLAEIFNDN